MAVIINVHAATDSNTTNQQPSTRFAKLDEQGKPLVNPHGDKTSHRNKTWSCVRDTKTGLTWEIKTRDGGIQDAKHSYSWYFTDSNSNGGFAGYANKGRCPLKQCNTQSYIEAINNKRLCNIAHWRLPTREELRSIIDYQVKYPGPVVDQDYFPNALSQFYWSSVADANDKDSAWGIGFSFGYDYAYFKSDLGYVRLVSGP